MASLPKTRCTCVSLTTTQGGRSITYITFSVPPSAAAKVELHLEKEDGTPFAITVNRNCTVASLKQEIAIEEKFDVKELKLVSSEEGQLHDDDDPEDADNLIVAHIKLRDDTLVSEYPQIENEVIAAFCAYHSDLDIILHDYKVLQHTNTLLPLRQRPNHWM